MRILIAEADAGSRRALQVTLERSGYEVTSACDGRAAWEALLAPDAPRLAVLDWKLPGMDGPEVCRAVRQRGNEQYVYLLLSRARDGQQDFAEGLEAGADDYLFKPFEAFELKARLDLGRRILDLQRQLFSAYEEMRHRAAHDPLTGLYNRGAILDELHKECLRYRRDGGSLGVVLCDLDHFKRVNDGYGHPAGDAVLREAARRIRSVLRAYDAIGRYGGEEFLVVIPRCTRETLCVVAERLREAIGEHPMSVSSTTLPVTTSIGVAISESGGNADPESLLHAADAALFEAKRSGSNRVVFSEQTEPELVIATP
jgi:diguanylate cyclase (GGDEF)-like protein